MGQGMTSTHVANATEKPIWVVYSTDKLRLIKMDVKLSNELKASCAFKQEILTAGMDLSNSSTMNMTFAPDDRVRRQCIPPADYGKFCGEGAIYASVFLQICNCCHNNLKVICENYHVPDDRSFIVAKNHSIKMQMYGENIWKDDNGINHRPAGANSYGP